MRRGFSLGQNIDYSERLRVTFEAIGYSVIGHEAVQFLLGYMAKWRMPQVVCQPGCGGDVWADAAKFHCELVVSANQALRQTTRYLGNLKGVCETVVKHVPLVGGHNLRHTR
jgi:hypothetical protein